LGWVDRGRVNLGAGGLEIGKFSLFGRCGQGWGGDDGGEGLL